ncbi:MAG: 30S ribosomal protein S6 [Candidatus Shikimatogenerans sp. Tser]|uniref:Small ribosomal subunit protein bS6 n=1 Tax=Candidatus Shikimatogenerans sp. Tser TaxID=3158568 RepID=A0AAU7QSV9_9FLAO
MNFYEIILILNPILEKKKKKIVKLINNYIKKKYGEIIYQEYWGIKNFSYIIKKYNKGFYYLIEFKILPRYISYLKKKIKEEENILRYLIIKLDKIAIKYLHNKRNIK